MNILLEHALFLPQAGMEPQPDMCVGVTAGRIAFACHKAPREFLPDRRVDCRGGLLMPGLVNSHTHSPLSLLRSHGEGLPLQSWLESAVWPFEARHTTESCYWGTLLNAAECIRFGVTRVCDMYIQSSAVAEAYADAGLRVLVTPTVTDALLGENPNLLEEIEELAERWTGDPLIQVGIAPHAVYTCGEALLKAVAALAERRRLMVHVHVSETLEEQERCRSEYGVTPLEWLDRFGLVTPGTRMAHCVWFTPEDIALAARRSAVIVHCPRSNLKLGSGFAPVEEFLKAGIPVALGTDSSASNNNQDVLEEARFASLLQRGLKRDPAVLPPSQCLAMATGGTAGCSCLLPGEPADLILIDRRGPHWRPGRHPLPDLLYAASSTDVRLTMVNGRILYEDGVFSTIDLDRLYREIPRFYPDQENLDLWPGVAFQSDGQ